MEASHPDAGTLHAWIEHELDSAEHARIESHVAECAQCREAVAEARGLIAGASRIVSALDDAPAGVIPGRHRFGAQRHRFVPARWAAAAAVLLFAATSVVVSREFSSGGSVLPTVTVDTAAPGEADLASAPAVAPAIGAEAQSPRTTTSEARGSVPAPRGQTTALSTQQARRRQVRDGRDAGVEDLRQFSQTSDTTAATERVSNEADFAVKAVPSRVAGQIASAPLSAPVAAPQPPPAAPPVVAAPRRSLDSLRINSGMRLSEVVVTGAAATASEARGARIVRVVRYEARSGVIVTLTEYEEPSPDQRTVRTRGGAARAQVSAGRLESDQMSAAPSSSENSYTWQDPARGRFFVLRGPLPLAELESLARRLGELKVVR